MLIYKYSLLKIVGENVLYYVFINTKILKNEKKNTNDIFVAKANTL